MNNHKGGRTSQVKPHHLVAEIKERLRQTKEEGERLRIKVILKILEGKNRNVIADELSISTRSVTEWLRRYNVGGLAGLMTQKTGRPKGNPKWSDEFFKDLARAIDKGGYWSIPKMQEWLKKQKNVSIPEQTVWYRMDNLKYSYKSARPHPVQGSAEKQALFKKGVSSRSWSR